MGMLRKLVLAFVAALTASMPVAANASRVSPMILELEPTGRAAIARVQLTNDGVNDIPFEVQMMRGTISEDGILSLEPAHEDFLVFPTQAIVEANSQQVFRMQYVGSATLDRSEIYYMSIRQVPVDFEEGTTQVQVVVNYNVLANVVPEGTRPEPVVRSARYLEAEPAVVSEPADGDEADPADGPFTGVEVDIANNGNRYFLAGFGTFTISGTTGGQTFEQVFTRDDLAKLIGVGVVAPGRNRKFRLPLNTSPDEGSLRVELQL